MKNITFFLTVIFLKKINNANLSLGHLLPILLLNSLPIWARFKLLMQEMISRNAMLLFLPTTTSTFW
jgi:hypothetical protein